VCIAALNCSQKGGICSPGIPCCGDVETLFCDYLNPIPNSSAGTGACRVSFPSGFACNASASCNENTTYTCKASAPLGNGTYCLANSSSAYLFPNWLKVGNASFTRSTNAHSGSSALQITSGSASVNNSYLYNSMLVLRNNSKYLLEFWTIGSGTPNGIRYAIFDPSNGAYLNSTGGWEFNRTSAIIFDSGSTSASYQRVSRIFRTLSRNVSLIEIRFYPSGNGSAVYLDDVQVYEAPDFTIMAYVRIPSAQNSSLLSQMGAEGGAPQGFNWTISGRVLNMSFFSANSTPSNLSVLMNISDSNWHQVALVVDRTGNYSAYLDGAPNSSGAFGMGRLNASASQFLIGAANTSGARPFNGSIDEVRIYQRALSPSEVAGHYAGRYQQECSANLTAIYNSTGSLSSSYNAYLRARALDSSTLLDLPFDQNATANLPGAVAEYSRFASAAKHNGVWTPNGHIGGAFNFTAAFAEVPSPVLPNDTGDFTLSAWINPASLPATMYIMGNAYDSYTNGTVLAACSSGKPCFYVNREFIIAPNYTIAPATWTHLAAVRKAGVGSIYANGVLLGTAAGGTTFITGWPAGTGSGNLSAPLGQQKSFIIGKGYISDGSVAYNGLIDEVRVFGRALSGSEINELYRDSYLLVNGTLPARGG